MGLEWLRIHLWWPFLHFLFDHHFPIEAVDIDVDENHVITAYRTHIECAVCEVPM